MLWQKFRTEPVSTFSYKEQGGITMDYAILDQLQETSEPRRELYQEQNNCFVPSGIEEALEPMNGSSANIKVYIYRNYFMKSGMVDLCIVIREEKMGTRGEFNLSQVECAIYPLYMAKNDAFDIPASEEPPNLHPDQATFILEKRNRHKKKFGAEFDPTKDKWNVNMIAEELNMSNRIVAQYCRALNI